MRWLVLVAVTGCWATPAPVTPRSAPTAAVARPEAPIVVAATPPPPAPTSVEVRHGRLLLPGRGNTIVLDGGIGLVKPDIIVLEGMGMRSLRESTDFSEIDYLSSCVRDIVLAQPEPARRPLVVALGQYRTSCDGDHIVLDRPIGPDRRSKSDASFTGTLSPRPDVSLRVAYCGGDSASPDHVTLVAESGAWTSPRLEFQRDTNNCDVAELPLTRALARTLDRTIESTDVALRFEGHGVAGELVLGDDLKGELRVILDAVDALRR
jgi:hypothetical protein